MRVHERLGNVYVTIFYLLIESAFKSSWVLKHVIMTVEDLMDKYG